MRKTSNKMKNQKQRPAWVEMFARTGRVESRESEGRDWHTDVPNIKLSRAFVVVLVLHVVAVGGILAFEMVKPDSTSGPLAGKRGVEKIDADRPAAASEVADAASVKPPAVLREEGRGGYERYIVQPGDSISQIAMHYRIARAELLAANRIDEMHPLVQGRILRVPRSLLPDPGSAAAAMRAVSALDLPTAPAPLTSPTLPTLPVKVADIAPPIPAIEPEPERAAPLKRPAPAVRPQVADTAVATHRPQIVAPREAPVAPASDSSASGHTIAPGDTLYGLSRKYGVGVDDILRANPGVDPRSLKIGQAIRLP